MQADDYICVRIITWEAVVCKDSDYFFCKALKAGRWIGYFCSKDANDYFKKVIELDTKGNLAIYAKRSIISLNKKPLESNIEENVTGNPEDYYSEGYRYYIGGNYSKSASMYKKYLAIKPEDDYIWYALGEVQLRLGKLELALEAFKKAIKNSVASPQ